jgi:hypothetical protein
MGKGGGKYQNSRKKDRRAYDFYHSSVSARDSNITEHKSTTNEQVSRKIIAPEGSLAKSQPDNHG